jgi:Fe-S cluster assembly scaffold protein SufB
MDYFVVRWIGSDLKLTEEQLTRYTNGLKQRGVWLDDDVCMARLVHVNGRFAPQLSKVTDVGQNLQSVDGVSDSVRAKLARLTDGFTDDLAVPVPLGDDIMLTSYKKLSGPNHNLGDATSQFAIITQQGTACFAALNTVRTGAVAFIHVPPNTNKLEDEADVDTLQPILIVNANTQDGGLKDESTKGVASHPRTLIMVEEESRVSVIQSCVDLGAGSEQQRSKLYNGYTQVFLGKDANISHSYLDETGGMVTPGVELNEDDDASSGAANDGALTPRVIESQRPALKDTHLEAIDVNVCGENGAYTGTLMSLGGSGRIRVALSVSLLRTGAEATINGFSLSGGAQRTDVKTNIHHISQGTKSRQIQKNMIGGRAVGSCRGRVRVEQSAQQTDSEQLSRTILLSDRSRAWAVPSLEIIADDVKCIICF